MFQISAGLFATTALAVVIVNPIQKGCGMGAMMECPLYVGVARGVSGR